MSAQPIKSTTPRETVIDVHKIVFGYTKKHVLSGVDLSIHRGEIVGLLGPNGCGKSTLLSLIAGTQKTKTGTISLFDVPQGIKQQAIRRRIGVVFQTCSLDRKLTTIQNLRLSAQIMGLPSAVASERIDAQLEFAGLTGAAHKRVSELSGGMKRKLDIARALLGEPELLLLDEPTSALDELAFRQTWKLIKQWASSRGATVVLTTHRPTEAERCDRLAIMANGRIVQTASPASLLEGVSNDVLVIEAEDLKHTQETIAAKFDLSGQIESNQLFIHCSGGHLLIPRIVEQFPSGALKAISLRRPDLGDAFLKITGQHLSEDETLHVS